MNTNRIHQDDDGQWYFTIRGKHNLGPFTSYPEAETALNKHVGQCQRRLSKPNVLKYLMPFSFRRRVTAIHHS